MTAPRRIVHVISSLAVGGAQGHLLQLLAEPTDGVRQDVIYFRDHDLRADAERLAGRVHHVPMAGPWGWRRLPQLTAAIGRGRYDVVQHASAARRHVRSAGRSRGPSPRDWWRPSTTWRLDWSTRPGAGSTGARPGMPDITIGISDAVRAWAVTTGGVPRAEDPGGALRHRRGAVRGPGSSGRARGARHRGGCARVVLCPARLDPQKNHGMLLRAFERVHRELPDAVLLLAGGRQLGSESLRARSARACRPHRRRRRGALAGGPERHVPPAGRVRTWWR